MTRHVLVTGALGFLGYPTVHAALARGWRVTALDIAVPREPLAGVRFERADVTSVHRVYQVLRDNGIDTIVHTGGFSGPMLARDEPYRVCTTNVVGTLNLLEAARVLGLARFVFLSSAHAYGDTPPAPVGEDAPFATRDIYGASKASGDLLARAYRAQHGLDAVALRISNGYGPRRATREPIRAMLSDAIAGRPTALDFGADYGRTFLYVRDAVDAIVAAVEAPATGQHAYNITGSEFVGIEHVADLVRALYPSARITLAPGADPLGYRREKLDVSAAARDLGWHPQWTLARGVADYARWLEDEARSAR